MKQELGIEDLRGWVGDAPENPFIKQIRNQKDLSPLQKKIAEFISEEAKAHKRATEEEASWESDEKKRIGDEFYRQTGLTIQENEMLDELVFRGELTMRFSALGHEFVVRDLPSDMRRRILKLPNKYNDVKRQKEVVASVLKEVDGNVLDRAVLNRYVGRLQKQTLDLIYAMYLICERVKSQLYKKIPTFSKTVASQIKFAILSHHNALVSDPLFQNLTEEQIYWHYAHITKSKEIENEIISSRIDYMTWFMNPEMAKKIQDKKDMNSEAESNLAQKYSFLSGLADMIKSENLTEEESEKAVDKLLNRMKSGDYNRKGWADSGKPEERNKKPVEKKESEGKIEMVGGDDSWYQGLNGSR